MLRKNRRHIRNTVAYLIVVGAFFFSLARIQQLSKDAMGTCHERQLSREAFRSLVVDLVQDYPEARRVEILTAMNSGFPPVKC